ncbi:hypothetical protein ACN28C_01550 [Plantactinospora sp. WMMC1484]|uniref:hypothetical protein n=1 Tax=Plantactinospora sp. WMMC1484 TaxID=3404122 RepID=UPI003BF50104
MPDDREFSDPTLDVRLATGRAALLDDIDQPPLARIRDRAAARRRHRTARAAGGAALLGVTLAAVLAIQFWAPDDTDRLPPPVADAPPGGPVYTGAGITINGLTEAAVAHVPGTITDVEFADPDHGYLLTRCPTADECPASVARTSDGGLSWQHTELPAEIAGQQPLDLAAFPGGRLLITVPGGAFASTDGGRSWPAAGTGTSGTADATGAPAASGDALLRAGPGSGRCGLEVQVWLPTPPTTGVSGNPEAGPTGPHAPATRPDLDVCWVAPAATADGAWWVGGFRDGAPAAAVTRDRGEHWRTVRLPGAASAARTVEVTSLGSQAYATVLGADSTVLALLHSGDGGATFTPTRSAGAGAPAGFAGAVVPLLDGRLLVAGTDRHLHVSDDDGATFRRAGGSLPVVGRLDRTAAGYVAYDLFGSGWAAYSADGATWRKLQVN